MKKLFTIITFLLFALYANAQLPSFPYSGNSSTGFGQTSVIGTKIGFLYQYSFADTSAANTFQVSGSIVGFLKNMAGVSIRCVNDIYIRSNDLQYWIKQASGSGFGTVLSVSGLSPLFTVSNPTTTPTFTQISQSQNLVYASPNGSSGVPTFRSLVAGDLPAGIGTVISVAGGNGMNFTTITGSGSVIMGTPSSTTLSSTNATTTNSHTHAFVPGGTSSQVILGNGTLGTLPVLTNEWHLTGNSGTTAGTNFIGTTDAIAFVGKTNNIERFRVTSAGLFGIGGNPSYKFDVQENAAGLYAANITNNSSTGAGLGVNTFSTGNQEIVNFLSGVAGSTTKFRLLSNGQTEFNGDPGTSGYLLKSNGTGSSPTWINPSSIYLTWQQTLVAGSTLNQNNTIAGGAFDFTFNNANAYTINSTNDLTLTNTTTGSSQLSLGDNNAVVSVSNSGGSRVSQIEFYPDSIKILPGLGKLIIDSLVASASSSDSILVKSTGGQIKTRAQSAVGTNTNLANTDLSQSNVDRIYTISTGHSLTFVGANTDFNLDINTGNFNGEGFDINLEGTNRVILSTENTKSGEFAALDLLDDKAIIYANDSFMVKGADTSNVLRMTGSTGAFQFNKYTGSITGTPATAAYFDASGNLIQGAIPAGTVTSVASGNGMNFSTITGTGTVTLGTPSSVTLASTNSLTSNSHTHLFAPGGTTAQYIRGDGTLATTPTGTITGSLTANRVTVGAGATSLQDFSNFTYNDAPTTGNGLAITAATVTSGNLVSLSNTGTAATGNSKTVLNIATSGANATSTQSTWGLDVSNTNTGTASTNIAARFSASGGTNNYGLLIPNGLVGIGISAPIKLFTAQSTSGQFFYDDNANVPMVALNRIASSGQIRFDMQFNGSAKGGINLNSSGEIQFFASSGGYFPTFYSNGSEAMRIATTGNVAIGNTSAAQRLDVTGNIKQSGFNITPPTTTAPTTGGTVAAATTQWNVINPAGTLATLTITLPDNPVDGELVEYSFRQIITSLTVAAGAGGASVDGITTAAANSWARWGYVASLTRWVLK